MYGSGLLTKKAFFLSQLSAFNAPQEAARKALLDV
jgi:hypothetical protein